MPDLVPVISQTGSSLLMYIDAVVPSALMAVFVHSVKDYRTRALSHVTFLLLVGKVDVDCLEVRRQTIKNCL